MNELESDTDHQTTPRTQTRHSSKFNALLSQADESRVFAEKTVPTSVIFAALAWAIGNPRGSRDVTKRCIEFLSELNILCQNDLTLTIRPEIEAGHSSLFIAS